MTDAERMKAIYGDIKWHGNDNPDPVQRLIIIELPQGGAEFYWNYQGTTSTGRYVTQREAFDAASKLFASLASQQPAA